MHVTRMENADGERVVWFSTTGFSGPLAQYDTDIYGATGTHAYAHGAETAGLISAPLAVYPILLGDVIKMHVFRAWSIDDPIEVLPCTLEIYYVSSLTAAFIGTDGEVDLDSVALHYFSHENASITRLLGSPNTDDQTNRNNAEGVMIHDDSNIYSLVARYPDPKVFDLIDWEARSVSTDVSVPTAARDSGVTMEVVHFGGGKYLCVCRLRTGIRKTLSVSVGSPWDGWSDIAPDYTNPAGSGTGEYIHVEPTYHDPVTGEIYLEGVMKVNDQYRFCAYHRRETEIATWRLLGRVQSLPETGNAAFAMTSFGRGAHGLRKRRGSSSRSAYQPGPNQPDFTAIGARATTPLSYVDYAI